MRYAQTDFSDASFEINRLGSLALPPDLSPSRFESSDLKGHLRRVFERVTDTLEKPDREVFVSLDREWIDCTLLRSDATLDEATRESYLRWVLAERLGTLWSTSVAFFQAIPDGDGKEELTFACIAAESLVEGLKSAINSAGCIPTWLEPSSLSIHRTVIASDNGEHSKTIVATGGDSILDAQFIDRGRLRSLGTLSVRSGKASCNSVQGDRGFADGCIEEWNSYLEDSSESPDLRVVLTGEFSRQRFRALKGDKSGDGTTVVSDPFPGADISGDGSSGKMGSPFVELLGLIQRRVADAGYQSIWR